MSEPSLALIDAVARVISEYPSDWEWPGNVNAELLAKYRRLASLAVLIVQGTEVMGQLGNGVHAVSPVDLLSPRERDVVWGLVSGKRMSRLAADLLISKHTARNHLKHAFRKLGVHSQVELLALVGGTRG